MYEKAHLNCTFCLGLELLALYLVHTPFSDECAPAAFYGLACSDSLDSRPILCAMHTPKSVQKLVVIARFVLNLRRQLSVWLSERESLYRHIDPTLLEFIKTMQGVWDYASPLGRAQKLVSAAVEAHEASRKEELDGNCRKI